MVNQTLKRIFFAFLVVLIVISSLYLILAYYYSHWLFLLALIIIIALIYFTFFYYSSLLYSPPVLFDEDGNIKISLYPKNKQAAFVFSNDDIFALTPIARIKPLISLLKKYKTKATFFVIPHYKSKFSILENKSLVLYLKQIQNEGFELAQHGLTHFMPKHNARINKSQEFRGLPFSEQKRRILRGRNMLKAAGFKIYGFRLPAFSATPDTFKILDESEFLYSSDIRVKPLLVITNRKYAESLFYPFHIKDLGFIEFVTNGDYFNRWPADSLGKTFGDYENLKGRFEKYYRNHGAFVLLTHINTVSDKKSLKLLERFLTYTQKKDLWNTTLHELARWWGARENLFAESYSKDDTLHIILDNSSEHPLKDLAIQIKEDVETKKYKIYLDMSEIETEKKKIIQSGNISDLKNRTIMLDI